MKINQKQLGALFVLAMLFSIQTQAMNKSEKLAIIKSVSNQMENKHIRVMLNFEQGSSVHDVGSGTDFELPDEYQLLGNGKKLKFISIVNSVGYFSISTTVSHNNLVLFSDFWDNEEKYKSDHFPLGTFRIIVDPKGLPQLAPIK